MVKRIEGRGEGGLEGWREEEKEGMRLPRANLPPPSVRTPWGCKCCVMDGMYGWISHEFPKRRLHFFEDVFCSTRPCSTFMEG